MTAALYDVKAKFSEYVTMAENGEVIMITKHGVPTTVMLSLKNYNQIKSEYEKRTKPGFMELISKWREENKEYLTDEYAETVERLVQEDKKEIDSGVNPWE